MLKKNFSNKNKYFEAKVWRFVADKNKPKKRSDLLGEINSDIKNMCSNKLNATLKQKIMVQDNKKWF